MVPDPSHLHHNAMQIGSMGKLKCFHISFKEVSNEMARTEKEKTNKSNSKMPSQMAKTQFELCSLLCVHNKYVDNNVALTLVSFSLEKHVNYLCIRA